MPVPIPAHGPCAEEASRHRHTNCTEPSPEAAPPRPLLHLRNPNQGGTRGFGSRVPAQAHDLRKHASQMRASLLTSTNISLCLSCNNIWPGAGTRIRVPRHRHTNCPAQAHELPPSRRVPGCRHRVPRHMLGGRGARLETSLWRFSSTRRSTASSRNESRWT